MQNVTKPIQKLSKEVKSPTFAIAKLEYLYKDKG